MKPKPPEHDLTDYEMRVFRRFVRAHRRGYWTSIQLEGHQRLPVVSAGLRMQKKGWCLTDKGRELADALKR